MKIDIEVDKNELLEQDISLDEIISNACLIDEKSRHRVSLLGNYVCTLIYEIDTKTYFINHPLIKKNIISLQGATIDLNQNFNGHDVLVIFDGGDQSKPIVTGLVNKMINTRTLNYQEVSTKKDKEEALCFEADKEIILKCGESSITLTKAGKILIRGSYLLSRSSGVNRIKGGSVHLN